MFRVQDEKSSVHSQLQTLKAQMISEAATHEAETERLAQALRDADTRCNHLQADVVQLNEQLSTAVGTAAKEKSEVRSYVDC